MLLVGALTFVPALALGPIVEHLILWPLDARAGLTRESMTRPKLSMFDRTLLGPAMLAGAAQARSARAVAQSRDVRCLHRQHPDDDPLAAMHLPVMAKRPPGSS